MDIKNIFQPDKKIKSFHGKTICSFSKLVIKKLGFHHNQRAS